jgi:hypothetical protein
MEKRDKLLKRIYNTDVDETHFHTELTLEEHSRHLFLCIGKEIGGSGCDSHTRIALTRLCLN